MKNKSSRKKSKQVKIKLNKTTPISKKKQKNSGTLSTLVKKENHKFYKTPSDKELEKLEPFKGNVPEMPEVPDQFFIDELCFWLRHDIQRLKTFTKEKNKDYLLEGDCYPPEPIFARDITGLLTTWKPIKDFSTKISFSSPIVNHSDGKTFLTNMLRVVKEQTTLLIDTYAKQLSIDKYLETNRHQTERTTLEKLEDTLKKFLAKGHDQLIPPLYNSRRHGLLMSYDYRSKELDSTFGKKVYEFGFSKTTSDNFTRELIKILEERKNLISNISSNKLVENEEKIEIRNYGYISCNYLSREEDKPDITKAQLYSLLDMLSKQKIIYKNIPNISLSKIIYYLSGRDSASENSIANEQSPQVQIVSQTNNKNSSAQIDESINQNVQLSDSLKNIVQGKVIDEKTKEPLAFANVIIKDTKVGTTTDIEGNFKIIVPDSLLKDKVIIEIVYIGYEKIEINLNKKEFPISKRVFLIKPVLMLTGLVEITVKEHRKWWQRKKKNCQ